MLEQYNMISARDDIRKGQETNEKRMHTHQDTDIMSNQGFISVRHSDISDELDNILNTVRLEPTQKGTR